LVQNHVIACTKWTLSWFRFERYGREFKFMSWRMS